jgi:AAA domain/IclR helix-turn-helix domain
VDAVSSFEAGDHVDHVIYGHGTVIETGRSRAGNRSLTVDFGWEEQPVELLIDNLTPGELRKVGRTNVQRPSAGGRRRESPRSTFADKILSRAQLRDLPEPEPLIDGVLDRRTMALLIGQWGSGKSFLALDWACCVATGKPWQGHAVNPAGPVLYVAAEGAYGLNARVEAWEYAWNRGVEVDGLEFYPDPVNLLDRGHVDELVAHVTRRRHVLVVLDTVARCLPGGDENSARDMGVVVAMLDLVKRATDGGVALGVHHLGKDKAAGARGSSALEAGVDTEFVVDKTAERQFHLHRTKRKDGPTPAAYDLELAVVGDSCVVQVSNQGFGQPTPNQSAVSNALSNDFGAVGATAVDLAEHTGLPRSSVYYALNVLVRDGAAEKRGGGTAGRYWPVGK